MIITPELSAYSIWINYAHTIKSSSAFKFKIIKQHCALKTATKMLVTTYEDAASNLLPIKNPSKRK